MKSPAPPVLAAACEIVPPVVPTEVELNEEKVRLSIDAPAVEASPV